MHPLQGLLEEGKKYTRHKSKGVGRYLVPIGIGLVLCRYLDRGEGASIAPVGITFLPHFKAQKSPKILSRQLNLLDTYLRFQVFMAHVGCFLITTKSH